jgi:hypothetical protein
MKNCAYCGRENTEDAVQCLECGTAFVAQPNVEQAAAEKKMLYGALWCIAGIAALPAPGYSPMPGSSLNRLIPS